MRNAQHLKFATEIEEFGADDVGNPPTDPGIKEVVNSLGDECVVVATDFSHPEGRQYVSAPQDVANLEGVSKQAKRKIVWDNALRLYPLDLD